MLQGLSPGGGERTGRPGRAVSRGGIQAEVWTWAIWEQLRLPLSGLDKALQEYPFETWSLTGNDLLQLSYRRLEELGLRRVGHQELVLEAVEQLCALNYELETTSLGTLTEKLQQVARTTQTLILSRRKVTAYDGEAIETPSPDLLACIAELITAAKGLFSWLNRYLFSHLNDYSASRDIVSLCGELAQILQKDCSVSERENQILLICRHLAGICENISSCSPAALLNQTAILESVDLVPTEPEDSLGIEIKSTNSCLHFIAGTTTESPADHCSQILPGDEIVQVNGQVVVGWTRMNLVKKILEKPNQVTLVLKKIPLTSVGSPCSPRSPCHQAPGSFSDAAESPGLENNDSPISLVSLPSSVIAGLDSALDLATDEEVAFDSSHPGEETRDFLQRLPTEDASAAPTLESQAVGAGFEGCSSPVAVAPARPSTLELGSKESPENGIGSRSRGPESPALPNKSSTKSCSRQKGVATRLSRRRVSCRELGKVDCDGWLLKKKDHVGFMSQKWKRCWFVLKGHVLYWYNQPSDEKAVGLINVSTYDLESTREQKKKYVFQLCHETYKPFIFAAETLADLSMWVSGLIAAKTKYKLAQESLPPREEDCYSETEAEDPDDDAPRPGSDLLPKRRELLTTVERAQPGAAMGSPDSTGPVGSPLGSPVPGSGRPCSPLDSPGKELESLIQCLKQGGVSLIGTRQLLTHEQYRRSFIKRNKNPQINERVHLVRALQSTLKAKVAELQILDQLLNDSELTSEKFRHWKEEHQELYQEIHQWWAPRPSQAEGLGAELGAESSPQETAGATP
ncbi:connector enhancer of kinase suppressor of ras 1 isoform X1 [Malaclemys terrapin pileata]|uniref:connector enhancer of kinase suppressor of ras 1 isoform X1 n=1 Tax=Malaclemys terrapin pileata TaxID=2991368 RepID=UPI0023A7ACBE|nr:connector enhancer of kinase suppressor of ras 1 isoform X1 [Malaclemys terrapin pileata]